MSRADPPPRSLPVTAVVVSRNEGELLRRCLAKIAFCDEILVVDLESDDSTFAVAEAAGARVIQQPAVESVERARYKAVSSARNDWLLYTDPDEEVPAGLARQLAELLPTLEDDVGLVYGPIEYRFGTRVLQGTVWGAPHWRRLLVRRDGVEVTSVIYSGTVVKSGYRAIELPFTADTAIVHHWVSGYRQLIRKHRRYARVSAEDRVGAGEATGWRAIVRTPWSAFRTSFFDKRGYLDGPTGLFLSLFWAWHSTQSELALKRRLDN